MIIRDDRAWEDNVGLNIQEESSCKIQYNGTTKKEMNDLYLPCDDIDILP